MIRLSSRLLIAVSLTLDTANSLAGISGEDILKKGDSSFSAVTDYVVDLDVAADVERMNIPKTHAQLYFKQPDKVHIESDQFAMLPREGLVFSASKLLERFTVDEVHEKITGGSTLFVLLLRPKDERSRSRNLEVCIDSALLRPVTIVSSLFGGRTMTAQFSYREYDGIMMPSQMTVQFSTTEADTTEQPLPLDQNSPFRRPRAPRSGTITIRYSNYRINTGLSDEIFENRK